LQIFQNIHRTPALGPCSLLFKGYGGLFPLGVKQLGHEVECSPPLVPRLRMSGTMPPLPNTPAWCGALLSKIYSFRA